MSVMPKYMMSKLPAWHAIERPCKLSNSGERKNAISVKSRKKALAMNNGG
jgi:hypothetical protein